jgi:methyl-accepting chemotaxis protein
MKHSVVWQMLLPIPIVSGIAIAAAAYFVPPLIASDAVESALAEAQRTVGQFRTLRGYYTKAVVAKVTKGSSLKAGFDHQDKADAIPLPATMIQDLSALLQQQGTSIKLYSPYPFPTAQRAGWTISPPAHGMRSREIPTRSSRGARLSTARRRCASRLPTA